MKFLSLIIIFFFCSFLSFCQDAKLSDIITNIAEDLAADESDSEAVSAYIERLYDLSENPVQLNSSPESEISRLFFLSDFQVKELTAYSHSSGTIISVFEIAAIPGFDKELAEMMIPFIALGKNQSQRSESARWRNTSITNFSIKPGDNDTNSLGSPWKILTKYKFTTGSFSGGSTAEKDAGEQFFPKNSNLPDFFSGHLAYIGNGLLRKIIIGDFSARFGQGININTNMRTGLSLSSSGYMSASDVIRPYTSTDENNFFRGAAAELTLKNINLSLFYSVNNIDGKKSFSSGDSIYIESFYQSGIHNTSTLLLRRDAVSEITSGMNLSCNFSNTRIGFVFGSNRFSLPVNLQGEAPKDIFDFNGERNLLASFYYNSLIGKILLYGEASVNEYYKYAFVQGISSKPSDRLVVNFLFRNYSEGFISFHGKSPGSSLSDNEQSMLGNATLEAARHLFISAGCEVTQFRWLKYLCSSPSWGVRQELRAKFIPSEKMAIDALFTSRFSMADKSGSNGIAEPENIKSRSIKFSVKITASENFILGTRIDYKISGPSQSKGALLLQDINYRFRLIPLTLWLRYCLFNTDDWNSRLYTYENDLLYSFSIPALSGEGSRSYIVAKWDIKDIAELRVKYAVTSLAEADSFRNNDEIRLQVKIFF